MQPLLGDRFLMDYFPRPLEGGAPLLSYARRPLRAPCVNRPFECDIHGTVNLTIFAVFHA